MNTRQIASQFARHRSAKRTRFAQPRQIPKGFALDAGWSSPVARQAHNLKAAGSNPAPATKHIARIQAGFFCLITRRGSTPRKPTKLPKLPKPTRRNRKLQSQSTRPTFPSLVLRKASRRDYRRCRKQLRRWRGRLVVPRTINSRPSEADAANTVTKTNSLLKDQNKSPPSQRAFVCLQRGLPCPNADCRCG